MRSDMQAFKDQTCGMDGYLIPHLEALTADAEEGPHAFFNKHGFSIYDFADAVNILIHSIVLKFPMPMPPDGCVRASGRPTDAPRKRPGTADRGHATQGHTAHS